jgi:hypothetical protein
MLSLNYQYPPEMMKRLQILNKGKSDIRKIKPFNFIMVGTSMESRYQYRKDIKPYIPYTKDYYLTPYQEFIDYHTGEVMKGSRYWKPIDVIFQEYLGHPEAKFDGKIGKLEKKYIEVGQITYIGKESNKLEENDALGVGKDGYEIYENGEMIVRKKKDLAYMYSYAEAEGKGISRSTLKRWRKTDKTSTQN